MQKTYMQGVLRETVALIADIAIVVIAIYSLISISISLGVDSVWAKSLFLSEDPVLIVYENADLELEVKSNESAQKPDIIKVETPLAKIKRVAMETSAKPTVKPQVLGIATEAAVPVVADETAVPIDVAQSTTVMLIEQYASKYGVDSVMMKKIAQCESGMRAEAVNGPYAGIYQFIASTWSSNRAAMGENTDPALRLNLEEAIQTAAFKMSRDGYGAWPYCSRI